MTLIPVDLVDNVSIDTTIYLHIVCSGLGWGENTGDMVGGASNKKALFLEKVSNLFRNE